MRRAQTQGFTLVDLLITIAIMSMLSSLVLASLNTAREKALNAVRANDLQQIHTALELYYTEHGYYPRQEGNPANDPDGDPGNGIEFEPSWFSDNFDNNGSNGVVGDDFTEALSDLVTDQYLPYIPNDPFYENDNNREYVYATDASVVGPDENDYFACGDKRITKYALLILNTDSQVSNMGAFKHVVNGVPTTAPNQYCIGE
jgi:prepilin-type N-terminal cleavage/methylation domain-containing protein